MKLVLATWANASHFGLLDELAAEGIAVIPAFDEVSLRRELVDADGVYGWPSAELLAEAKQLRWLQSPSAGVEALGSLPELQRSNVVVANARGAHAPNMAEHVFAMILAFSRGILQAREFQKEHRWEARTARESCSELAGKTLGVIGYGNIGRQVARRARAFDLRVLAVDAQQVVSDDPSTDVWPLDRLDDLLAQADVVVVASPATPESKHLIGPSQLRRMKSSAGLVVISRGALFDHDALAAALRQHTIAWAGVDATEPEPLPAASPLWDIPTCLITPHSSGHSIEKERRVIEIKRENARRLAVGKTFSTWSTRSAATDRGEATRAMGGPVTRWRLRLVRHGEAEENFDRVISLT
jgi:phosphoglycerate dehydrogenase-like enzyme